MTLWYGLIHYSASFIRYYSWIKALEKIDNSWCSFPNRAIDDRSRCSADKHKSLSPHTVYFCISSKLKIFCGPSQRASKRHLTTLCDRKHENATPVLVGFEYCRYKKPEMLKYFHQKVVKWAVSERRIFVLCRLQNSNESGATSVKHFLATTTENIFLKMPCRRKCYPGILEIGTLFLAGVSNATNNFFEN